MSADSGHRMFLLFGGVLIVLSLQPVVSASCPVGELPCDSGRQCISREFWCDKDEHCDDGSDEAYCDKKSWWDNDPNDCDSKIETHVKCDSGICYPKTAECDGYKDCKDGFDEKNCEKTTKDLDDSDDDDDSDDNHISSRENDDGISPSSISFTTQPKVDNEIISGTEASSPSLRENHTFWYDLSSFTTTYYQRRMGEGGANAKEEVTAPHARRTETTKSAYLVPVTTPVPQQRPLYNTSPTTHHSNYLPFSTTNFISPQRQFNYVRPTFPSSNNRPQPTSRRIRPPLFVNLPSTPNARPVEANRRYSSYNSYNGPEALWNKEWRSYNRQGTTKKPFHFGKDYAKLYSSVNANSLREAEKWLLQQRSKTEDWGDNSGRALVALALTRNGYRSGDQESEIIKRRFMVKLGADLIRNPRKDSLKVNRLSMSILALLAVCEDPRDFHGLDLTEVLRSKIYERTKNRQFVNPNVYLSLCLSNRSLSMNEVNTLMQQMTSRSLSTEMSKDMQSLATQAFACYLQQSSREKAYKMSLRQILHDAVVSLLQRMDEDGSFGSVYSTALAAQALISTGESSSWDSARTMAFLRQQQQSDGSFGNILATYFTLPALSGRSTLHLRNIHCNATTEEDSSPSEALEFAGPKQYIHYSIYFGQPLVNSHSIRVLVPQGINFLDVMKIADSQDSNFRYAYEERDSIHLYSLSGIPNDPERGLSWHIYVKQEADPDQKVLNPRERFDGDLRHLNPRSFQHVIFWYHPNDGTRREK